MRRDELKYSIETILNDIDKTDIYGIIETIMSNLHGQQEKDPGIEASVILTAYGNFFELSRRYSENELKIMKILKQTFL